MTNIPPIIFDFVIDSAKNNLPVINESTNGIDSEIELCIAIGIKRKRKIFTATTTTNRLYPRKTYGFIYCFRNVSYLCCEAFFKRT